MIEYKRNTIISGKYVCIIVDENGNIVNRNPKKCELKGLCEEPYFQSQPTRYTDEELLEYPRQFEKENGRPPTERDFNIGDQRYPCANTYIDRFGSWNNVLKLIGMDSDTIIKQGKLLNDNHKGRLWEISIIEVFDNKSIDLSGNNWCSPYDGICPNGKIYDAKSSGLSENGLRWDFHAKHKDKCDDREAIEFYYLGAFDRYYKKLLYVWRIPGEMMDNYHFSVGTNSSYEFNIENMKEYDITEKFKSAIMNGNNEMLKKLFN